jgi:ABC-type sulfate transport system substrate-binding protein
MGLIGKLLALFLVATAAAATPVAAASVQILNVSYDPTLKVLYTPQAQEIIARHYFRPRNKAVAAKYKPRFPNVRLFTIDRNFGGWRQAQANHFNDGALFDQVFEAAKR